MTADLTGEDGTGGDFLQFFDNVGEGEVGAECLPGAVGGGLKEGDVDAEGVVDGKIMDVAGSDAVGMLIAAVEVADVALRGCVTPDGDTDGEDRRRNKECFVTFFHIFAIITIIREQAS